jgi:hypothetical protein
MSPLFSWMLVAHVILIRFMLPLFLVWCILKTYIYTILSCTISWSMILQLFHVSEDWIYETVSNKVKHILFRINCYYANNFKYHLQSIILSSLMPEMEQFHSYVAFEQSKLYFLETEHTSLKITTFLVLWHIYLLLSSDSVNNSRFWATAR